MVLPVEDLEYILTLTKAGDRTAREKLLAECRPFIARVTAGLCRRRLEWGFDDELSIAFMAFNEAIDRYQESRQVPFLAFARLMIKSRVTDYLRKEARLAAHHGGSLQSEQEEVNFNVNPAGLTLAWQDYLAREAALEREEEIQDYAKLLAEFAIEFSELVRCAPKHQDTRRVLLGVARRLAADEHLFKYLMEKKEIATQRVIPAYRRKPENFRAGTKIHHCHGFIMVPLPGFRISVSLP